MSYQQLPGLGAGSRIGQSVQYAVQVSSAQDLLLRGLARDPRLL
jgi:hypothetical protein